MRYTSLLLTLGSLVLAALAQSQTPDKLDGEVAAFVTDWAGNDSDRIAAHFTDDGNLIVPNSPTMTGRDSIAKTMKNVVSDPRWSLILQPVQVEVSKGGDLGYARGTYVLKAIDPGSGKVATEKGRFIAIFRKQSDGTWKAVQQISNPESATLGN
jgi:uncharacterized protein (TIGR02246 family)